jgi:hypothetical protein
MYWWGITCSTVTLWRKALGAEGRTGTEGSRRLVQAAQERAVDQLRGKPLSPEQIEQRRRSARELGLAQHLEAAPRQRAWPGEYLALLGTMPDEEVAERTGHSANGVRVKRCKLGIPHPSGPGWTAEELELLGKAPDAEVAALLGRKGR